MFWVWFWLGIGLAGMYLMWVGVELMLEDWQ